MRLQGISVDPTDPTRFFQQEDNSTKARPCMLCTNCYTVHCTCARSLP